MRTEISQARKENQFYLSSVEKSKALKRIEERKRKRGEEMDFSGLKKMYRQRKTVADDGDDAGSSSRLPDELLLKVCCCSKILPFKLEQLILNRYYYMYSHDASA